MSSNRYTYIGAYGSGHFPKAATPWTKLECSSCNTSKEIESGRPWPKFCDGCGGELTETHGTTLQPKHPIELLEELELEDILRAFCLWDDESEEAGDAPIVLASNYAKGEVVTASRWEPHEPIPITPETITKALADFSECHAKDLALLRGQSADFQVMFGAVTYWD